MIQFVTFLTPNVEGHFTFPKGHKKPSPKGHKELAGRGKLYDTCFCFCGIFEKKKRLKFNVCSVAPPPQKEAFEDDLCFLGSFFFGLNPKCFRAFPANLRAISHVNMFDM